MTVDIEAELGIKDPTHRCEDFDEDCPDIHAEDYCLRCWLHDPTRGICPYLTEKL